MRLTVPALLVLLYCSPAQGVRVVAHVVPSGVGLHDGYRPFPVFCRGNTVLIHFQARPKLKATSGPSEGRLSAGTLRFHPALRRLRSAQPSGTVPLNPGEIEVSCRQGQAQVRAGEQIQLEWR